MNITLGFLPSLMLWRAWRIGNATHTNPSLFPKDIFYIKYTPELEFDLLPTDIETVLPTTFYQSQSDSWRILTAQIKKLLGNLLSVFELEEEAAVHLERHQAYSACAMQHLNQYTRLSQTASYLQPVRFYYDFHCELPVIIPKLQRGSYLGMKNVVQPTYIKQRIPKGSLYELVLKYRTFGGSIGQNIHIYVLSPEFLLVYVARYLSKIARNHIQNQTIQIHNMLRLMCEFAGTYTYDPLFAEETIYNVKPLCKLATLKMFCAGYYGATYRSVYKQSCSLALDGLASPFETTVALALSLPEKYGGIHLGIPLINQTRILEDTKSTVLHHWITPDIYFKKYHLAIECNGEKFHNTKEGYKEDQRRARDYAALGDIYLPVVYADIRTVEDLQKLLHSVIEACLQKENTLKGYKLRKRVVLANKNRQQEVLVKIHS